MYYSSRVSPELSSLNGKFPGSPKNKRLVMYFLLVILIILLVMISLIISQYKSKAIKSGEAGLSLTEKNILPFCSVSRYCSIISFFLMVASGVILILAPVQTASGEWKLFDLTFSNWSNLHFLIGVIFILSFAFHSYIHWNWIKELFASRPNIAGKNL